MSIIFHIEFLKLLSVIISLFGYCFVLKKHYDQNISSSIILVISLIVTTSFFSSLILGDIFVVSKIFYFAGILSFSYFISSFFFNKKLKSNYQLATETIISPFFLSFFIICIYNYFIFYGSYFHVWDEFSHWGLAAKEIFIKDRLFQYSDLANNLTSDPFFSYAPGSSIFIYFILKNITPFFREDLCYFAISTLLTVAILCPISYFISKEWRFSTIRIIITTFLYIAIFYIIKSFLVGGYFNVIYVDTLLGLFYGALLLNIALCNRGKLVDKIFFGILLFFLCFFIALIKHSGAFLIFLSTTLFLFYWLQKRKFKFSQYHLIFDLIIPIFISLFAMILAKTLWLKNIKKEYYGMGDYNKKIDFYNLSQNQLSIIYNYIKNWLSYTHSSEFRIFLFLFIFLVLMSFIIRNLKKFTDKRNEKIFMNIFGLLKYSDSTKNLDRQSGLILPTLYCTTIIYLIYSISLLYLYLTVFSEYEALQSASYERYLFTIILALSTLLLGIIFNTIKLNKLLTSILLIFFVVIFFGSNSDQTSIGIVKNIELASPSGERLSRVKIKQEAKMILEIDESKKILPIFHNFIYPECYVMNYELSPHFPIKTLNLCEELLRGIFAPNGKHPKKQVFKMKPVDANYRDDILLIDIKFDLLSKAKEYDIIFIPRADEELWKNIGVYFSGDYKNFKFFTYDQKIKKFIPYKQ